MNETSHQAIPQSLSKQLVIEGLVSSYTVQGEGEHILLLHGWGCRAETFRKLQAELARTHKVFALDFPGFGKSDEPTVTWGPAEYAAWTEQLMRKAGIQNPIVLGHSFGGRIALVLNGQVAFKKLVLTGGAGLILESQLQKRKSGGLLGSMKSLLEKALPKESYEVVREKFVEAVGSADYKNASPQMREILKKVIAEDLSAYAAEVRVPTLLIWGENDRDTPPEMGRRFHELIRSSELKVLPDCGHYVFLDKEVEFNQLIRSFL